MEKKCVNTKQKYKKPEVSRIGNIVKNTWGSIENGNDAGTPGHNTGGANS